jgi:hypothetical protein
MMAGEEKLQAKLEELRDSLEGSLGLDKSQLGKIDSWIDLAKKAHGARVDWAQAEEINKVKAEKDYNLAKNAFEQAITAAKGDPTDPKLADSAKLIRKGAVNNDDLYGMEEKLTESMVNPDKKKAYSDMNEGELLWEILSRMFGLIAAGVQGLKYLWNENELNEAVEKLAEKRLQNAPPQNDRPLFEMDPQSRDVSLLKADPAEQRKILFETGEDLKKEFDKNEAKVDVEKVKSPPRSFVPQAEQEQDKKIRQGLKPAPAPEPEEAKKPEPEEAKKEKKKKTK